MAENRHEAQRTAAVPASKKDFTLSEWIDRNLRVDHVKQGLSNLLSNIEGGLRGGREQYDNAQQLLLEALWLASSKTAEASFHAADAYRADMEHKQFAINAVKTDLLNALIYLSAAELSLQFVTEQANQRKQS